jgi:hypothetical protein
VPPELVVAIELDGGGVPVKSRSSPGERRADRLQHLVAPHAPGIFRPVGHLSGQRHQLALGGGTVWQSSDERTSRPRKIARRETSGCRVGSTIASSPMTPSARRGRGPGHRRDVGRPDADVNPYGARLFRCTNPRVPLTKDVTGTPLDSAS